MFNKDIFLSLCKKYNVELSETASSPMIRNDMDCIDEEIQEKKKNKLATEIVELFEKLLDKKGIEIPCDDEIEQKDRYEGGNAAKLYGMEYYNLVSNVQNLLYEQDSSFDISE